MGRCTSSSHARARYWRQSWGKCTKLGLWTAPGGVTIGGLLRTCLNVARVDSWSSMMHFIYKYANSGRQTPMIFLKSFRWACLIWRKWLERRCFAVTEVGCDHSNCGAALLLADPPKDSPGFLFKLNLLLTKHTKMQLSTHFLYLTNLEHIINTFASFFFFCSIKKKPFFFFPLRESTWI